MKDFNKMFVTFVTYRQTFCGRVARWTNTLSLCRLQRTTIKQNSWYVTPLSSFKCKSYQLKVFNLPVTPLPHVSIKISKSGFWRTQEWSQVCVSPHWLRNLETESESLSLDDCRSIDIQSQTNISSSLSSLGSTN